MRDVSPEDITRNPDAFAERIVLDSGEQFLFRPLKEEDSAILGTYFLSLSGNTRKMFGPHPFTREQAQILCEQIDYAKVIRLIATNERDQIVAYFILRLKLNEDDENRYRSRGILSDLDSTCSIAPSIADHHQNRGLGTVLMGRALALGWRLGQTQAILQGGVRADNARGLHFYPKCGFREVGSFCTTADSFDMVLDLAEASVIQESREFLVGVLESDAQ